MGLFLDPGAKAPARAKPGDVAADLFAYSFVSPGAGETLLTATQHARVRPHCSIRICTGVHLNLPHGFKAVIEGRSGLAHVHCIDVGAGQIDNAYTGSLNVILFNHGEDTFTVKQGDRIAQLAIERYWEPVFELITELPITERGATGFGSTGLR